MEVTFFMTKFDPPVDSSFVDGDIYLPFKWTSDCKSPPSKFKVFSEAILYFMKYLYILVQIRFSTKFNIYLLYYTK